MMEVEIPDDGTPKRPPAEDPPAPAPPVTEPDERTPEIDPPRPGTPAPIREPIPPEAATAKGRKEVEARGVAAGLEMPERPATDAVCGTTGGAPWESAAAGGDSGRKSTRALPGAAAFGSRGSRPRR